MWCAIAMWPLLRRRRSKIAVLAYPVVTLFCIIVTGNHFWLDGVGGVAVFGVGALVGWGLHRWNQDRLDGRHFRLHTAGGPATQPATQPVTQTATQPATQKE